MAGRRSRPVTARRTADEVVVPLPKPALVPKVRITPEVVAHARMARRRGRPAENLVSRSPFDLPSFPPGVAASSGLAQDAALSEITQWASNQYIGDAWAEGQQFLGYSYLAVLAQRPEYRVISEVIASAMTREWIEIKSAGNDDKTDRIKVIEDAFEELGVREAHQQAATHDGQFGRGQIFLDVGDDPDDAEALKHSIGDGRDGTSQNKVSRDKPLKALRVVEPVWTYPQDYNSSDPLKSNWYRPETWTVMGHTVHRTRLLTYIGRPVPDMLKPAYAFGGLSMTQMVKPYVDNWLRTRQAVSDLIHSFSVQGLKTNLGALMQIGGQEITNRVDLFNALRDNSGAMLLDKDTEEWFNVTTPLSTLDQLQAQAQEHMAAISRIPLVVLLGISPHGLNASTEGELRAFYDWIAAFQEWLFRANLTTILGFVQLSKFGDVDPGITIEFKPLWQLDDEKKAAVEQTKAATHQVYADLGAVSPEEVRTAVAGDPDSAYAGLDLDDSPAPGPPDAGGEGGAPPDDAGQPGPDDDAADDTELGVWSKKATALFADKDDLNYWSRRANQIWPDSERRPHVRDDHRWAALAAKLFDTSNTGEPASTWIARVVEIRASWVDRAAAIPRNVTQEPSAKSWVDKAQRAFPGDLGGSAPDDINNRLAKASQNEVDYEYPATGNDVCRFCAHFEPFDWPKQCSRVDGLIEPEAWCKLFEAREQAQDKDFKESDHPRGQPGNAGQFGPGGGSTAIKQPLQPTEGVGKERTAVGGKSLPPHIAALKIPPAWTDVQYSSDPKASLLATGRDAKGREQRVYSAEFAQSNAEAKFARIHELNSKFADIKQQNELARRSPDKRIREAADVTALIMATGIRPGGEGDTGAEKQAFGATTLKGEHIVLVDDKVRLRFVGKKGVDLDIPVENSDVAKMLVQRAKRAAPSGQIFPAISAGALLNHVHSLDGGGFKTKDFRTLHGTKTAMREVAKLPTPKTESAYKKSVRDVAKVVAEKLGNTPIIALQSYISPVVFAKWRMASGAA